MGFIQSAEHVFSRAAHEVIVIGKDVERLAVEHKTAVANGIAVGGAIATAIDPAAALAISNVSAGMETAWGKVCAAVAAGDALKSGGYIQIPADENFIDAVKAAIASIEQIKPGTSATAAAVAPVLPKAA